MIAFRANRLTASGPLASSMLWNLRDSASRTSQIRHTSQVFQPLTTSTSLTIELTTKSTTAATTTPATTATDSDGGPDKPREEPLGRYRAQGPRRAGQAELATPRPVPTRGCPGVRRQVAGAGAQAAGRRCCRQEDAPGARRLRLPREGAGGAAHALPAGAGRRAEPRRRRRPERAQGAGAVKSRAMSWARVSVLAAVEILTWYYLLNPHNSIVPRDSDELNAIVRGGEDMVSAAESGHGDELARWLHENNPGSRKG
ncbi:hypothetical protein ON010_g3078 [Phytophthora cinnamomi]|nr:hypothetical protein ON010_g3078 [Phytophthora cinnamomi]